MQNLPLKHARLFSFSSNLTSSAKCGYCFVWLLASGSDWLVIHQLIEVCIDSYLRPLCSGADLVGLDRKQAVRIFWVLVNMKGDQTWCCLCPNNGCCSFFSCKCSIYKALWHKLALDILTACTYSIWHLLMRNAVLLWYHLIFLLWMWFPWTAGRKRLLGEKWTTYDPTRPRMVCTECLLNSEWK